MLDAQMVLMDALRVFDERERDRANGKEVPSFESLYPDVLPEERAGETGGKRSAITADLLGLADIDRLEKKIPRPVSDMELFDPVEIHRQRIRELLADFSVEEQEAFVAYLKKSVGRKAAPDAVAQQAGKAVVLFSSDKLIRHAVMTICKEDGVPVFATDAEKDLERLVSQCLSGDNWQASHGWVVEQAYRTAQWLPGPGAHISAAFLLHREVGGSWKTALRRIKTTLAKATQATLPGYIGWYRVGHFSSKEMSSSSNPHLVGLP